MAFRSASVPGFGIRNMAQLQSYERSLIVAEESKDPVPGAFAQHVDDQWSFGTIVAVGEGMTTVLWSKQPWVLNVVRQDIKAVTRRLTTTWSMDDEPNFIAGALTGIIMCKTTPLEK